MAVIASDNGAVIASAVVAIARPPNGASLWCDVYVQGVNERICLWFTTVIARDAFFAAVVAAMK